MSSVKIEIEEPLAAILHQTNQPVQQAGREMIVLEFYRRGTISSGKAAELLGMERIDFIMWPLSAAILVACLASAVVGSGGHPAFIGAAIGITAYPVWVFITGYRSCREIVRRLAGESNQDASATPGS